MFDFKFCKKKKKGGAVAGFCNHLELAEHGHLEPITLLVALSAD
jgi:hypothetical protein